MEVRLSEASRMTGKSESEVIREALDRYCNELGNNSLYDQLSPFIGVVSSGLPSVSRRTGEAFTEMLLEERERQRERRRKRT